jgi:hypothetical protein
MRRSVVVVVLVVVLVDVVVVPVVDVVVVVFGTTGPTHPPVRHASQQCGSAPVQAVPPLGGLQPAARARTRQRVLPLAFVRQHATAPGRPHVDASAQASTARAQARPSPPPLTRAATTLRTQAR